MQWDGTEYAGFSDTSPWLPLDTAHESLNVSSQMDNPASLLNFYHALLALRNHDSILRLGTHRFVSSSCDEVLTYVREFDGVRELILLNFGRKAAVCALSDAPTGSTMDLSAFRILFSTDGKTGGSMNLLDNGRCLLGAHQGLICRSDT